MSYDPGPNREAYSLLKRAVALDPNYAAAWYWLSQRAYYKAQYDNGGEASFAEAEEAGRRALELDPNNSKVMRELIIAKTEKGALTEAYDQAKQMLEKRPDDAEAHFALSYVLRYGGMLKESAKECDIALAKDPRNFGFRSCALVSEMRGDYARAKEILSTTDPGSNFARQVAASMAMRQGDLQRAKEESLTTVGERATYVRACIDHTLTKQEIENFYSVMMSNRDPEPKSGYAGIMAFCGQPDYAIKLLETAIDQNFCGEDGLQSDPLLKPLQNKPEFQTVVAKARACRLRFQEHTKR